MSSNTHQSLPEYRGYLKEKLDDCFTRKDGQNPSERFARNGVTEEIFDKQTLFLLLKLIIDRGPSETDATHQDFLLSLVWRIKGSETESLPCCCNILATLLYARCTDNCLKTWATSSLPNKSHDREQRLISDADLPLTLFEARATFGYDDGHSFWEQQALFCPVTLKEFDESVYEQSCPLPFAEKRVSIGRGNYAKVYRVKIEKGHMINETSGWALQSVSDNFE